MSNPKRASGSAEGLSRTDGNSAMSTREKPVQASSHERNGKEPPSGSAANSNIVQFCLQHNIVDEFAIAERLVKERFPAESFQVEVETDRDSGDSWVAITVPVKGKSTEEALAEFRGFADGFAAAVPSDRRRFICVSLDFQA